MAKTKPTTSRKSVAKSQAQASTSSRSARPRPLPPPKPGPSPASQPEILLLYRRLKQYKTDKRNEVPHAERRNLTKDEFLSTMKRYHRFGQIGENLRNQLGEWILDNMRDVQGWASDIVATVALSNEGNKAWWFNDDPGYDEELKEEFRRAGLMDMTESGLDKIEELIDKDEDEEDDKNKDEDGFEVVGGDGEEEGEDDEGEGGEDEDEGGEGEKDKQLTKAIGALEATVCISFVEWPINHPRAAKY
ncbi:hypothetical protein B0T14DRAFT_563944 [Immersiella caudata]|uniref:Uncharacterized protein n=1 Tax=Immersiella caudata TaxID=314043 RepID=A0AA39WVS6_9PEZI|nr:hypothetical protein B0T14DRAFT_563944 [Immersiella caudata]